MTRYRLNRVRLIYRKCSSMHPANMLQHFPWTTTRLLTSAEPIQNRWIIIAGFSAVPTLLVCGLKCSHFLCSSTYFSVSHHALCLIFNGPQAAALALLYVGVQHVSTRDQHPAWTRSWLVCVRPRTGKMMQAAFLNRTLLGKKKCISIKMPVRILDDGHPWLLPSGAG